MVLWGAAFGGLVGWLLAYFEFFGLVLGVIIGALGGWWLKSVVRSLARQTLKQIVDAELKDYIARQIKLALAARDDGEDKDSSAVAFAVPNQAVRAAAPQEEPELAQPPAAGIPDPTLVSPARILAPAASASLEQTAPAEPTLLESGIAATRDWLLGGNMIVRIGLVILFVGLSFLANFAANAGVFPIELRLALVGLVGGGLLAVGFNRRTKRPEFGLALQGGGVAVLYLTLFAAARLFAVMPPLAAFVMMVVIAALGVALALLQDSRTLALASFVGGFAVPLLIGGEAPTPLPLFAYGTVLNLAILVIARLKSWRALNLLGFFATFAIGTLWSATSYDPQHFWLCQAFLAITVTIYLLTAMLYAHNTPGTAGLTADSTLLFGTALAGFGLQAGLLADVPYGPAFGALGFAAVYLALATWLWRNPRTETRVLGESLIAIGAGFVTLAVPLALDVRWTGSAWAVEGAGAFWVGARQARWLPRAFGLALIAVAALISLGGLGMNIGALPFANQGFFGALLIAVPLLAAAWWLRASPLPHSGSRWAAAYAAVEPRAERPAFLGGFLFVCIAIAQEVTRVVPPFSFESGMMPDYAISSQSLRQLVGPVAIVAAMWLSLLAARRWSWEVAAWPSRASLPLLLLTLLFQVFDGRYILYFPDIALWAAALALAVAILRSGDAVVAPAPTSFASRYQNLAHAGTVWLATGMLANALYFAVDQANLWNTSWSGVSFLVAATCVLGGLVQAGELARRGAPLAARWPLAQRSIAYAWTAAIPLVVLVYGGALVTALFAQGISDPLPYLPILSPVDLSVLLALAVLALWRRMACALEPVPAGAAMLRGPLAPVQGAILGFLAINAIWLRTAHHWLGVEWQLDALAASGLVQAGLSILWTLLAMALMLFAKRRAMRVLWLIGAGLLGLVVAKLLLVDMSNVAGWQRIVSFMGVGMMMLIIGYLVPLPPRRTQNGTEQSA